MKIITEIITNTKHNRQVEIQLYVTENQTSEINIYHLHHLHLHNKSGGKSE